VRDQVSAILANTALAADQVGPLRTLPTSVNFAASCTGFAPTDRGVRFNRLGGWCNLGSSPTGCPDVDTGSLLVDAATPEAKICLLENQTNLQRILTLNAAGRVKEQQ
jgi:hypothetical protein